MSFRAGNWLQAAGRILRFLILAGCRSLRLIPTPGAIRPIISPGYLHRFSLAVERHGASLQVILIPASIFRQPHAACWQRQYRILITCVISIPRNGKTLWCAGAVNVPPLSCLLADGLSACLAPFNFRCIFGLHRWHCAARVMREMDRWRCDQCWNALPSY